MGKLDSLLILIVGFYRSTNVQKSLEAALKWLEKQRAYEIAARRWSGRPWIDHPVISYTRPCGHFTSRTKNNFKKQRKEGKTKNAFETAKHQKARSVPFFWYFVCMYAFGNHKCLVKFPTATKNADSSLVIVFTAQRGHSDCSRSFSGCRFSPDCLTLRLPTLRLQVLNLTDQRPWSLPPLLPVSDPHTGSHGPFLVWKPPTSNLHKATSSGNPTSSKDTEDKIPSFDIYLRTYTETHTHTYIHIYIYIYIYIYMNTHYCDIGCHKKKRP